MEEIIGIFSAKHIGSAFAGFLIFGLISNLQGKYCFRGLKEDKRLSREWSGEIGQDEVNWSIIWTRQDVSMMYGQINIIAALLGAILVVLLLK